MSTTTHHRKTTGQWLIPAIFLLVYVGILAVFAVQTYFLVDWLFPAQNFFMKVVTVFTFDGIALLCACAEAFYSFRRRQAHQLVRVAWTVSFIGSCLCTGVWMILSASTKLDFVVPYWIIVSAYVIVTAVFILDIVLGTFAAMDEWRALHPLLGYDDEENMTPAPREITSDKKKGLYIDKGGETKYMSDLEPDGEEEEIVIPAPSDLANGAKKKTLPKLKP